MQVIHLVFRTLLSRLITLLLSIGAMENWGLVTYREPYLLFNDATGTARNRENVISTISHEFAVSIKLRRTSNIWLILKISYSK